VRWITQIKLFLKTIFSVTLTAATTQQLGLSPEADQHQQQKHSSPSAPQSMLYADTLDVWDHDKGKAVCINYQHKLSSWTN
jgi:hypothetical protein